MVGNDAPNPLGAKTMKGEIRSLSSVLDSGVFPGMQGGPLEHVIAAKAVAFNEALTENFKMYGKQVIENANALANHLMAKGYEIVSGGTDNHCFLIDLRNKNISGKDAELALVSAEITVNKNMVPFDDKSPFVTSGIRIGTPAITTRGLKVSDMEFVANAIDRVILNASNEDVIRTVKAEVHEQMSSRPLFA
jgi:glycine hydroxymethyltransferase